MKAAGEGLDSYPRFLPRGGGLPPLTTPHEEGLLDLTLTLTRSRAATAIWQYEQQGSEEEGSRTVTGCGGGIRPAVRGRGRGWVGRPLWPLVAPLQGLGATVEAFEEVEVVRVRGMAGLMHVWNDLLRLAVAEVLQVHVSQVVRNGRVRTWRLRERLWLCGGDHELIQRPRIVNTPHPSIRSIRSLWLGLELGLGLRLG